MYTPTTDESPYKKDVVHNLGYKPIVMAFSDLSDQVWDPEVFYQSVAGWREIPIYYYGIEDTGFTYITHYRSITYQHIDSNTIRFYGPENQEITGILYLEPREDAWYE